MRRYDYKINLSYGSGTGDLYEKENLDHFANSDLKGDKCDLITADGGIEVKGENYNY